MTASATPFGSNPRALLDMPETYQRVPLAQGVIRLPEAARSESDEGVEHRLTEQLHGVACEKQRDIVTRILGGARDEEREGGPSRVLRAVRDVDENLGHGRECAHSALS